MEWDIWTFQYTWLNAIKQTKYKVRKKNSGEALRHAIISNSFCRCYEPLSIIVHKELQ